MTEDACKEGQEGIWAMGIFVALWQLSLFALLGMSIVFDPPCRLTLLHAKMIYTFEPYLQ